MNVITASMLARGGVTWGQIAHLHRARHGYRLTCPSRSESSTALRTSASRGLCMNITLRRTWSPAAPRGRSAARAPVHELQVGPLGRVGNFLDCAPVVGKRGGTAGPRASSLSRSATELAAGFSPSTCLPLRSARSTHSARTPVGSGMYTCVSGRCDATGARPASPRRAPHRWTGRR
jgi:hypothetical protein